LRPAAGPGGRYITEQRLKCVSIDFFTLERVQHSA